MKGYTLDLDLGQKMGTGLAVGTGLGRGQGGAKIRYNTSKCDNIRENMLKLDLNLLQRI